MQRAIVYAALSARPPVLAPRDLTSLQQAVQQEQADLSDFNAAANTAEQQLFTSTVSGAAVDRATWQEDLAEQAAAADPAAPLTRQTGLSAATWYGDMSTTIGDTRQVTDPAAGQVTARAGTLKSDATRRLAAHQHRHARPAAPRAADLGSAGPLAAARYASCVRVCPTP